MSVGMGYIIQALGASDHPLGPLRGFIGTKLAGLSVAYSKLTLRFENGGVVEVEDTGQTCCEVRSMTCDDDLAYHVGATFLGAEVADAPSIEDGCECHDVEFLRITTSLGVITIANHNEHNGYYGGFLVAAKLIQGGAQ